MGTRKAILLPLLLATPLFAANPAPDSASVNVTADWSHVDRISNTVPTTQILAHSFTLRDNPMHDPEFAALKDLKTNAIVTVEYGDKSVRNFMVVDVKSVPEAQAGTILFEQHSDISNQLNLITCGGKFDTTTNLYTDRVIVVTKLIS